MRQSRLLAGMLFIICFYFFFPHHAKAGIIDRIVDIYQAPEKLEKLQQAYTDQIDNLQGQLESQSQLFESSRAQVEELLRQQEELRQMNREYMAQNEALQQANGEYLAQNERLQQANHDYLAQNEALQIANQQMLERLEQIENDRASWVRKIILSVATVLALITAYAMSVRIWRYIAWRKQRKQDRKEVAAP